MTTVEPKFNCFQNKFAIGIIPVINSLVTVGICGIGSLGVSKLAFRNTDDYRDPIRVQRRNRRPNKRFVDVLIV